MSGTAPKSRHFAISSWIAIVAICVGASACGNVNAALEKESQARQLAADLRIQFTKAASASDRSVMADTDEASVSFAKESAGAKQAVQSDIAALGSMLSDLKFSEETELLQDFSARFKDYDDLDQRVLSLAIENTNLKAQRLSFGQAQQAANAFHDALESPALQASESNQWHARALAAEAVSMVRAIQVDEAPHIAEADDAAMTKIEARMTASEAATRNALASLASIAGPQSAARVKAADAALDRFIDLNRQIIALSRRNTNVRSLALSLSQKPALVTACDEKLGELQNALAKRGYTGARWK